MFFEHAFGCHRALRKTGLRDGRAVFCDPPSRQKIAEFQAQQEFRILPHDDPGEGNVYKDLKFPPHVYDRIEEYYEERV